MSQQKKNSVKPQPINLCFFLNILILLIQKDSTIQNGVTNKIDKFNFQKVNIKFF